MLTDFDLYDQYVDLVSIFEWLFTDTKELPATTRHFERYPSFKIDGVTVTPDFTILLNDDSAVIGEIARISLQESSVEKLTKQIGRYDKATEVPSNSKGQLASVKRVDVLWLVPMDIGPDAVKRVIRDRLLDPTHSYKPQRHPVIAQFSRSGGDEFKYHIQHIPDPDNGTLPLTPGQLRLGDVLRSLNVPMANAVKVKAQRKFMNDGVDPLYLATHLVVQELPTMFGGRSAEVVDVDPAAIAEALRKQYGKGRKREVEEALNLLARAGIAREETTGWTVSMKPLRSRSEKDVHKIIAQRATRRTTSLLPPSAGRQRSASTQLGLFTEDL